MKQRDWFWCGAVLSALVMFISLQSIQEPMYAGIAGGVCALASAALFGYGLRAQAREQSARSADRVEEERTRLEARRKAHAEDMERIHSALEALKGEMQAARESAENGSRAQKESITGVRNDLREWFDARQQSDTVILQQVQTDLAAVTEEIRTLRKAVSGGMKLQETAVAKLSGEIKECALSDQAQAKESAKAVCDTLREQQEALNKELADYKAKFEKYCGFMIDQPWNEIGTLSEGLQSVQEQAEDMLSAVDSISSATEKLTKKALDRLTEDSRSLQEKLQYVCETLETQGRENRDTMNRMIEGYSDVTAQDVEILTALTRSAGT